MRKLAGPRLSVSVLVALAVVLSGLWLVSGSSFSRYDAARATQSPPPPTRGVAAPLPGSIVGEVGLVSFNALKYLDAESASADWERLTTSRDVDIVGWQEADSPHFDALAAQAQERGWTTWQPPRAAGDLAFSWRADRFRLVATRTVLMHGGADYPLTTDPFPSRWVAAVALVDRDTDLVVTVMNTHLNQGIEGERGLSETLNGERAREHLAGLRQVARSIRGDVVLGVGDLNFDYRKDVLYREPGGVLQSLAGEVVTSYQALGLDGVQPTRMDRWIDYAFILRRFARTSDGAGVAQFARHASLAGFNSDHRPLFAEVRLYAPAR